MTDETIRDLLIEIKTKLDMALNQVADHEARVRAVEHRPIGNPAVEAASHDHEVRIRALEAAIPTDHQKQHTEHSKFRWVIVGAAAVVGGVAGKLVGLL